MSASERESSSATATVAREVDPLLRDLNEKKQSFRRNVVSLAAELKDVRCRLAAQEHSFAKETLTRQEAETKAKMMADEISTLQKNLEEKNVRLRASTSAAEMPKVKYIYGDSSFKDSFWLFMFIQMRFNYVKELGDLRIQLTATKESADASALSAQSAQSHCLALANELKEKNRSLREHETRVTKLGEQLDLLQRDLQAREISQTQLKDEVSRFEHEIMQALAQSGSNNDCELRKILDEVTPRNLDKMNKLLTVKDQEIDKLRDEITIISAHWKLKTKELESQLDKHRRADQELKKKVLKLEFCLQEARAQIRKLQRMGERTDKAIKELRDQLATKQQGVPLSCEKQNFWKAYHFEIVASMSMLVLVMFSRR
ncbi:hypothetical protein OROMI_027852 [Orobanche minor]